MLKAVFTAAGAIMLAGCSLAAGEPSSASAPVTQTPSAAAIDAVRLTMPPASVSPADLDVLFWTDPQREARFRAMEDWFPGFEVSAAPQPRRFAAGKPYPAALEQEIADFVANSNAAGLMVIESGKKRSEHYALGFTADQRWTSFSVAKSFTSTLLGAAMKDGHIARLEDSVAKYIPEMAGSAYENVTVEQLATMTSGVRWNEDYTDPKSDVARMGTIVAASGEDAIVTQLKALPREAPPGEKWVYKTGETNLLGLLVERATGMSLAAYSKSKIVDPAGFESSLFWMIEPSGRNIGGCCLSITLGDYARMGQFALEGGDGIVPEGWFAAAGAPQVSFGDSGFGYGYQWWTYPQASFGAQGIFGQAITIVPEKQLVVAVVSNWPTATSGEYREQWQKLVMRIAAAD